MDDEPLRPPSQTHYVIVRSDLPLGFLVAQAVHAAGESSPTRVPVGTNAVVLSVPGEPELLALAARLEAAGVAHTLIREPDAPWLGQATAIGIEPVNDRSALRPLLCTLPLLREREEPRRRRSATG